MVTARALTVALVVVALGHALFHAFAATAWAGMAAFEAVGMVLVAIAYYGHPSARPRLFLALGLSTLTFALVSGLLVRDALGGYLSSALGAAGLLGLPVAALGAWALEAGTERRADLVVAIGLSLAAAFDLVVFQAGAAGAFGVGRLIHLAALVAIAAGLKRL